VEDDTRTNGVILIGSDDLTRTMKMMRYQTPSRPVGILIIPHDPKNTCYLLSTSAASISSGDLGNMLHGVHDLKEGHGLTVDSLTSLDHRMLHVGCRAMAASVILGSVLLWLLVSASWLLADKFALRSGAESWLLALPVTLSLLAHGSADGIRSGTSSTALSWGTDSLALGAVSGLAEILGATNIALRLVAMDLAGGTRSLLTVNLALWTLADWVALSRA